MKSPYTIQMRELLGKDLRSRSSVADLLLFMKNTGESSFIIDFSDVQFVTRSFMDEFYNGVIKPTCPGFRVRLEQVPADIQAVLDVVKGTQKSGKKQANSGRVLTFKSLDEVSEYLKGLAF